jgi:hypothetical protein
MKASIRVSPTVIRTRTERFANAIGMRLLERVRMIGEWGALR